MEQTGRSFLLLANKRSGKVARDLEAAVARMENGGLALRVEFPQSVEQLRNRICDSAGYTVVLAGGDGTLNAAAPALLTLERPFGLLPCGTANDLARTLGIPFDPVAAAGVILEQQTRRIDLGLIDGQPFFNVASIGLSAEIARRHKGERKRRLGVLNYPLSAWAAFRSRRPFSVELVTDGERSRCYCILVAVGNGRHYGGGMTIDEAAEIDDGWLHVYYLRPTGIVSMLWMLPAMRFGWLRGMPEAEVMLAKRVELRTRRPRPVNVDGELNGRTPVVIEVMPAALEVFAPPPVRAAANGKDDGGTPS